VQTGVLWDAILQGKAGGYPADLKLLYIASSNCLNQYLNSNKGMAALKAAETVVVHEQFMTATARFADIVLPVCMSAEYNDIAAPGYPEPYYVYVNKATEPQGESRSDFEIASALAPLLGLENFSGKTEVEWHKQFVQTSQITDDFEGFRATGIQRKPMPVPKVSLKPQIESPGTHKFPTPSGKIEIFSQQIADWKIPGLTPIPCYLESGESPLDPQARLYPLQLITSHSLRRANSCFELVPWLNETDAQVIIMNPIDAAERGIADGDEVETYNSRGRMVLRACVTGRIMPGVVDINQGAWFQPDAQGIDRGGCPNTLSRDWHSPGGAFPSNTCLVQVVKTAG
jgi:anaerobic dimethyl sulfoxide reductase subunit A